MKNHMRELWDDTVPAGVPNPRPDPDAVLRRVNAALDGKHRFSRRPLKYAAILAAAVLLLTGTAIASEQGILPSVNVLDSFFHGDSSDYSLSLVNAEQASVSDDNYTMTVTSSIADRNEVYFTLTVEAKTEEARKVLSGEAAKPGEDYEIPLSVKTSWIGGNSGGMFADYDSENQTLNYYVSRDMGPGLLKEVSVRLEAMEDGVWLKFPVKIISDIRLNIQADGQGIGTMMNASGGPVTLEKLVLSPASVKMYYTTPEDSMGDPMGDPLLYFLWKDGSLSSYGQLRMLGPSGHGREEDGGMWSFQYSWRFGHLLDLRQMEAVIFENTAYPLDGGEPYAYEVDPSEFPRPFAVPSGERLEDAGNSSMPLFAVCGGLGIPYEWDEEAGTLTATFRDVTMTFTVGSDRILLDGAEHETEEMYSAAVYQDGELWADAHGGLSNWQVRSTQSHLEEGSFDCWLIIP